jgi:beta-glucosidase
VPARAFSRWDTSAGGWAWPRELLTVHVGRSSRDLRLSAQIASG